MAVFTVLVLTAIQVYKPVSMKYSFQRDYNRLPITSIIGEPKKRGQG
jgi:hypothetical protein